MRGPSQSRSRGENQFLVSNAPHMNDREAAKFEGMAGELENQGQSEAANRVRRIVSDRKRMRPGVGVMPEPGKKGSVVIRKPYGGSAAAPPPPSSNVANPGPPPTANTPTIAPAQRTVARPKMRPVGGGTTESALANARAEVAKRARK